MGARARVLLAATIALLIGVVAAPAALAVTATVRVEGTPYQVAPATAVSVPAQGTIVDTDGTSYDYTTANAFAALDLAAALRGFTYGFNTSYGAPFLEMVAGLEADPSDYSNGWTYMVNGVGYPILDMGVIDFLLQKGDRVVFTQNPDATFTRGAKLLRLRFAPGRAVKPGQSVMITVLGDDVAKANSSAEAARYGLDPVADPSVIEKAADFAPVVGATLHVGSRVYVDGADSDVADGKIAVTDLPNGTYGVWAEKAMDASYTYVRAALVKINVDDGARISNLRVSPSPYRAGSRMVVRFRLFKAAKVSARIVNARGRTVAMIGGRWLNAGSRSLSWSGRTRVALTGRLSVKVKTIDSWGRIVTKSRSVRVVR